MPARFKVSHPLIADMVPFVNISNFSERKTSTLWYLELQHVGILEMRVLCFSMQGEGIFEHTNGKGRVFTF